MRRRKGKGTCVYASLLLDPSPSTFKGVMMCRPVAYCIAMQVYCRRDSCVSVIQVIAAEGEQKASRALKEAADVISQSPSALQLRYLQTLTQISAEKNSTIIFPIPIEMMNAVSK